MIIRQHFIPYWNELYSDHGGNKAIVPWTTIVNEPKNVFVFVCLQLRSEKCKEQYLFYKANYSGKYGENHGDRMMVSQRPGPGQGGVAIGPQNQQ